MTDPSDETRATPKLNRGTLENLLGFFDSFAVIFANEEPVPDKMNLGSDEIGSVIWHSAAPMDQAGAQHSQSPITAEGGAMIRKSTPVICP